MRTLWHAHATWQRRLMYSKNNGHCFNCPAPDSICNFILTTRKGSTMNAPAPRIKVILVGECLGY